jgi:hypothetical protein
VSIVLPPKLMAGHPATLAVLGVDGKLASGVKVTLSDGQTLVTDRTGRAIFNVPATGEYLIAKGSGASVAALIDPATAESEPKAITLPPIVSIHDRFWICGAGLQGNADQNSVRISSQPAAVIAASPVCLVALPGAGSKPGAASIAVEAPGVQWSAETTLVALEFIPPNPPLKPGEKGDLVVRVDGSAQKLGIVVQNQTPGVLKFLRGDAQELLTGGGTENIASLKVQALASGDFSFGARLLPSLNLASAERYLKAAQALASRDSQRKLAELAGRLAKHPKEAPEIRAEVERMEITTIAGDLKTLLEAADDAL